MNKTDINYLKAKEKYLKFLKSQEVAGVKFKNKFSQLINFYIPISNIIFKRHLRFKSTQIIGLAGGQGSGKSTISKILKIILKEKYNLRTTVFSIDDFYKTLKERKKMSKKISPLFLTRGVPGTHDSTILYNCLKSLKKRNFKRISIPKFNKSIDDRVSKNKWTKITNKPDIVIFEGWCVGALAQKKKDLEKPFNDLERHMDKNMIWRNTVNNEIKNNYKKIFDLIDLLVFLKIPSFKYVYKWRLLQEKKLHKTSKGKKIMNKAEIKKFIMYYERTTKNMFKNLKKKSDIVISIDTKHRLKTIRFN